MFLMTRKFFIALCAATACAVSAAGGEPAPLRAVVTVGMVADLVREIGGTRVEVTQLVASGIDPHLYRPTRGGIRRLLRADAIFYVGFRLEGKMASLLSRLEQRGRRVYAVAERVDARLWLETGEREGADPHLWSDVGRWMHAARVIEAALIELDPAGAALYRANADRYLNRLAELDAYIRRITATIPPSSRVLITAHDAFRYFGDAYGFEVIGIQGFSTESEAGLARINSLVDLIVDRRIPAIFVETSVSDRNVRALIEGARARGHDVKIGGSLFSDSMGTAGTYEGTYIGMMDHNATTIARALGGEAPAGGLHGQLKGGFSR